MYELYPYTQPEFLNKQSVDEIHQRMLQNLPDDIDKSELQIPWDFTRPTAIEKAELVQFQLAETIKLIFPQWSYGIYLDNHAQIAGLSRREANKSACSLYITGLTGTEIPKGFLFATPAQNGSSILFEARDTVTIDGAGEAIVPVQAVVGGIEGNVTRDTIILMVNPLAGIKSVTNLEPATGGSEIEDDETLRQRVIDAMYRGESFTGCDKDYKRWAEQVPGVGKVIVIPTPEGRAGVVKLVIVDTQGQPASETILEAVYNYIMSDGNRLERLAPIGAELECVAPEAKNIWVKATVVLKKGAVLETVIENFRKNLDEYFYNAASEGVIKYVMVGSILAQTDGVDYYENLLLYDDTMENGAKNIPIELDKYPAIAKEGIDLNVDTQS